MNSIKMLRKIKKMFSIAQRPRGYELSASFRTELLTNKDIKVDANKIKEIKASRKMACDLLQKKKAIPTSALKALMIKPPSNARFS